MKNILNRIIVRDQNCIITGATGNLGKSISFTLAEMGFNLILTDKNLNQLKSLKKEISLNYRCKVYIKACDLSKENSRLNLIKFVNKNFKKIDLLINNAALTGKKEVSNFSKKTALKKQSLKDWQSHIDINLTAIFHLSKDLSKLLIKSKKGKIINVGSIYAFVAPKWELYKNLKMNNRAGYAASKGGLLQLTKWLSTYLAPHVRVNMISPGGIYRDQIKSFKKKYVTNTPLNRMGTEKDVIGSIIFLSSDLSEYVTGHNLIVDGGWSAW